MKEGRKDDGENGKRKEGRKAGRKMTERGKEGSEDDRNKGWIGRTIGRTGG